MLLFIFAMRRSPTATFVSQVYFVRMTMRETPLVVIFGSSRPWHRRAAAPSDPCPRPKRRIRPPESPRSSKRRRRYARAGRRSGRNRRYGHSRPGSPSRRSPIRMGWTAVHRPSRRVSEVTASVQRYRSCSRDRRTGGHSPPVGAARCWWCRGSPEIIVGTGKPRISLASRNRCFSPAAAQRIARSSGSASFRAPSPRIDLAGRIERLPRHAVFLRRIPREADGEAVLGHLDLRHPAPPEYSPAERLCGRLVKPELRPEVPSDFTRIQEHDLFAGAKRLQAPRRRQTGGSPRRQPASRRMRHPRAF